MTRAKPEQPFPLKGTRVLDLSQAVSGPYAGRILSDLGAEVVKVEWLRGDVTSVFGRRIGGLSGLFLQMNAGKRGISLDLSHPAAPGLIMQLAAVADIVIENFRPGVLDRLGLSYGELSEQNPGLVMLSISGFGRDGPESQRQAYAPVLHAESGLLTRQAEADGRAPVDTTMALADTLAALHGTIAILAALRLRTSTGAGQHIDLGMLQAMVASDDYTHNSIDSVEQVYPVRGDIWPAAGGPVLVAADPKTMWAKLRAFAGLEDPSAPGAPVAEKVHARRSVIAAWMASFETRESLIAALEAASLPWAELRTKESLLQSPTLQSYESVAVVDTPNGPRGVVRTPYRFSAASSDVVASAPTRGQHNHNVFEEWLGLDTNEVAALEAAGALLSG